MKINRSPLKAIRAKCLDCCCGQTKEVRECTLKTCPLWPFRSGHRLPKETVEDDGGTEKNATTVGANDESGDSGEEEED